MSNLTKTDTYKCFIKLGKNVNCYSFKQKLNRAAPIFVFQMREVSSSSISTSLTKQHPGTVGHVLHIDSDYYMSELLYNWAKEGNPLKITSPIREQIGRNIYPLFQSLAHYTRFKFKTSNLEIDQLINIFHNECKHDRLLAWFDDNTKKHFGTDAYSSDASDNDIATYTSANISLPILRATLDDAIKEKATHEFLKFPSFTQQPGRLHR